ncbi:hypothetical protein F5B20DRAFT_592377 [Whalleya microplaca]|nr:hypothetical protein F5B20DRAFT_592377 [Whalleya microplaca]
MFPYHSYPPNPYVAPPPYHPASILARHFGPYGMGPLTREAVQFMNTVAPGFTFQRRPPPPAPPAIRPRSPRPYSSQGHRRTHSSRPVQHPHGHGHGHGRGYGYRPVYYPPHPPPYGYGYGYGPGYRY